MKQRRKASWLFLEWLGTTLFGVLPDVRVVNVFLARMFYFFVNRYTLPNLSKPLHFNEKLINMKVSDEARKPLRARVTDKELVKQYVTTKLGPGHVVPTLALIRGVEEIDAYVFPLPCVVKPTHSSQEVMCFTTEQPTKIERRTLKYWLRKDYFAASREPNYRHLERKLIVEPLLGGAFGEIEDIKVMCFHGRPKLIHVDHGRYSEHRRDYFDAAGRPLPIELRYPAADLPFPFPAKFAEILRISAALSAPFKFIRVDFYVVDNNVLVGELTSFPSNCVFPFRPSDADLVVARLFDEPDLELHPALFGAPNGQRLSIAEPGRPTSPYRTPLV